MAASKIYFNNDAGHALSGRLELPENGIAHHFAVFAHCFTCSKNLLASRAISKALTASGFGVLSFDFTGLGDSEGDFEHTNFSGNVDDIIVAINYLTTNHKAPGLLVGHSLGGAAVIHAAAKAPSIQAIATIGAPSDTIHVQHLFKEELTTILEKGEANVTLSGRDFKITSQFVQDLNEQKITETLNKLRKPLLILHAPQDTTVSINHAEKLYKAAMHPKSFVSLDGADHLLMNKQDAHYVANMIAAWASRYIPAPIEKEEDTTQKSIKTPINGALATLTNDYVFKTDLQTGNHHFIADEPLDYGGTNLGPTPYDFLSSGLAACTVMTVQMYTRRKQWDLKKITCHVHYDKQHAIDCELCEENAPKIDTFTRTISFEGNLDDLQIARMLQIADKCPVHKTLHSETQIITKLAT